MARMQNLILGGLSAAVVSFAVPAIAAPAGLAETKPAAANQATLVRGGWGGHGGGGGGGWSHGGGGGGWGHGGGGWGHHAGGGWGHGGGWHHGGYGRRHGYPYFAYWGGYPYYNDYYFDDYGYDYSDDACYYSRRLRARVCPEY